MSNSRHQFRKNFTIWALITLTGTALGASYALITEGYLAFGVLNGFFISSGVIAFEMFFLNSRLGTPLRRMQRSFFLIITALVWISIIFFSLHFVSHYFDTIGIRTGDPERHKDLTLMLQDTLVAYAFSLLLFFAMRIRGLVGARVLFNFLLSRYHRPLHEERIFLFIDLVNSTGIAEKLGDLKTQALIAQFFFDIAKPIVEYGGETHRYIGDEVVVTWKFADGIKSAKCVHCIFAIQDLIAKQAQKYRSEFGLVPQFRAGMHGGSVVASEVGDDKLEIVYFGDTVNVAARLERLCKEMNQSFLISEELMRCIDLSEDTVIARHNVVTVSGKERPIEIYSLVKNRPLSDRQYNTPHTAAS